jgi:hypothetical protein
MTAQPKPTQHPSLQRHPVLAAAVRTLTTHTESAERRRERLQRYDVAQVQQVLAYIEALENTVKAERMRRVGFEANAEGEFAELRLQVREWQAYAAQLEERRDRLASVLSHLLYGAIDTRPRWWWFRARRQRVRDLAWALERAETVADAPEPTPPVVEAP